jgi:RNA polymerase sigma factor FliA
MSLVNDLILSHADLVPRALSRYRLRDVELREDLESIARLALVKSAHRYRGIGPGFGPYARARVAGAIKDELRKRDPLTQGQRTWLKRTGRPLEDAPAGLFRSRRRQGPAFYESVPLAFDLADPREPRPDRQADQREWRRRLGVALPRLPERLRLSVELTFLEGLPLREVARRWGLTEGRLCQLRGQALETLRRMPEFREAA